MKLRRLRAQMTESGFFSDPNQRLLIFTEYKDTLDYAARWRSNRWRTTATRQPAKNADLWQELLDLARRHQVTFIWVKGHVENPENCRCDELAVLARQADDLPPDEGFESLVNQPEPPRQMDLFGVVP